MIYTSYFAKMKSFPENFYPVSICRYPPKWCNYNGAVMKELSPTPSILWEYKDSKLSEEEKEARYMSRFENEVLSKLSITDVMKKLTDTLPFEALAALHEEGVPIWESKTVHIVMLCFEKPSDFCHRHLGARWMMDEMRKLGTTILVKEASEEELCHTSELHFDKFEPKALEEDSDVEEEGER